MSFYKAINSNSKIIDVFDSVFLAYSARSALMEGVKSN